VEEKQWILNSDQAQRVIRLSVENAGKIEKK